MLMRLTGKGRRATGSGMLAISFAVEIFSTTGKRRGGSGVQRRERHKLAPGCGRRRLHGAPQRRRRGRALADGAELGPRGGCVTSATLLSNKLVSHEQRGETA